MLSRYPVDFTDDDVRAVLEALQSIYRPPEIEKIVLDAHLPVEEIDWLARADLTWRSIYTVAVAQLKLDALLDTVAAAKPILKPLLDEVRSGPMVVSSGPPPARAKEATWHGFSSDGSDEAVIIAGQPTFVDVQFLATGAARARSVCRLTATFGAGLSYGTAFRIGERRLLTNHHVLFDRKHGDAPATAVDAWFNFEADDRGALKPMTQLRCDPATLRGEAVDDWAVVDTEEPIPDEFPRLELTGAAVPAVDDRVCIIQHPEGQPKKVAFQHNLVRWVDDDVIQYWTDTDFGSSGSPVFNEKWQIVALHHFAVASPSGEDSGKRNQGRRIDRIVERLTELEIGFGTEEAP